MGRPSSSRRPISLAPLSIMSGERYSFMIVFSAMSVSQRFRLRPRHASCAHVVPLQKHHNERTLSSLERWSKLYHIAQEAVIVLENGVVPHANPKFRLQA